MPIINPPAFMQVGTYNARVTRMAFNDILESGGVMDNNSFHVEPTTPSPSMAVRVRAGGAYVVGSEIFGQGLYFVELASAISSLPVLPNNGIGPRQDTVYVAVRDSTVSGSMDTAVIDIAQGTEGGLLPGAPPANATALTVITVKPGATSITTADISSARVWPKYNKFIIEQDFQINAPVFTPLTPAANWANYNEQTDSTLGARTYGGTVELKGLLRYSGPAVGGTNGVLITTLPTQFRPVSQVLAHGLCRYMAGTTGFQSAGTQHSHDVPSPNSYESCRLNILPNGRIELQTGGTHIQSLMASAAQYVSLVNVTFDKTT